HVHREEEVGKWRGLVGYGLLEEIVGHLFLASGDEVALIVFLQRLEERRDVDDVGVHGYGEGFCDFSGDEDFAIVLLQVLVFPFQDIEQAAMIELSGRCRGSKSTDGDEGGASGNRGTSKEGASGNFG